MRTWRLDDIAFGAESRVLGVERHGDGGEDGTRIGIHRGPIRVKHSTSDENAKNQMKHSPARIEPKPRTHDKEHNGERRHYDQQRHCAGHATGFRLLFRAEPTATVVGTRAKARPLFAAFAAALVARHALAQWTTVL